MKEPEIKASIVLRNNNYTNLDGIRGLAIIFVVLYHYLDLPFFSILWIGVDLFFVLSGFLITGILYERLKEKKYFSNFYIRRALRIFPLYFAVTLLFMGFVFLFVKNSSALRSYYLENIVYFLTYTQNYFFIYYGLPEEKHLLHTWSLAIEEQFYLIWPMFIFLIKKIDSIIRACVLLLVLIILGRIVLYIFFKGHLFLFLSVVTRMDQFIVGAILVLLFKNNSEWLNTKKFTLLFTVSGLLLAGNFIFFSDYKYAPFFANGGITLLAIFFSTWIFFGLTTKIRWINRFLGNKILVYIGKISYGVYMFNWIILVSLEPKIFEFLPFPSHYLSFLICLILTAIFSIISYEFFEKKFLKLKSKF